MKNTVKVNLIYYPTEDITLPSRLIEATFYLAASFACVRGGWGKLEGGLEKIKILFTGMVGPYREIFPSVFKTSRNISLYGPPFR